MLTKWNGENDGECHLVGLHVSPSRECDCSSSPSWRRVCQHPSSPSILTASPKIKGRGKGARPGKCPARLRPCLFRMRVLLQ